MKKTLTIAVFVLMMMILLSSYLSLFIGKPTMAVVIRTWSMEPLITRGDLVFLRPVTDETRYREGQIIVFKSEDNKIRDWTMHRIVSGEPLTGFLTKGDNNEETDQTGLGYPPIQPEWIAGIVPQVGGNPAKIPLVGYITLIIEENLSNPFMLPAFVIVMAVPLLVSEISSVSKRRPKEETNKGTIFMMGGLALFVVMAALMVKSSLFMNIPYGVEEQPGVMMGSQVGILRQGDELELELAVLNNKGSMPANFYVVSNDSQVMVENSRYTLLNNTHEKVMAVLKAESIGIYHARVNIGLFFPFLPSPVIGYLVNINYWLALFLVSITPCLPVFAFPYFDRKYRRKQLKSWRRRFRKIHHLLPKYQ